MIEGVAIDVGPEAVWVRARAPLWTLASAVVGGDLATARHVVNLHVPPGHDCRDPAGDLRAFARRRGIGEPFVGLMTAARTDRACLVWEAVEDVRIGVVATVGLGTPVTAGVTPPAVRAAGRPGTINVIAVLDAALARATAVNGVITVTEAKVAALARAGIVSGEGAPATGTVTDAVVLGWTGRGPLVPFLGPGTTAGFHLARAVRRAVGQGIVAG